MGSHCCPLNILFGSNLGPCFVFCSINKQHVGLFSFILIFFCFFFTGENASIGCVMEAIPNVLIEWEWRGRAIRNMSLMTFGRQMYLIRESYSPSGVMMSLLPVDGDTTTLDLISMESIGQQDDQQEKASQSSIVDEMMKQPELSDNNDHQPHQRFRRQMSMMLNELDKNLPLHSNIIDRNQNPMDSLPETLSSNKLFTNNYFKNNHQQHGTTLPNTGRVQRSLSADNTAATYKRTSTLYIMNALEKDSGRYVCFRLFANLMVNVSKKFSKPNFSTSD